jgi:hypothetical protein
VEIVAPDSVLSDDVERTSQMTSAYARSKWDGELIGVCFEDPVMAAGFAQQRQWVQDAVQGSWQHESGVTFTGWGGCAVASAPDVRIGLTSDGALTNGLGSEIRGMPNGVVLQLAWPAAAECARQMELCVRASAVHEFGHVLGFTHEHNRPDAPAWCRARHPPQGEAPQGTTGTWDAYSVMNYCNTQWNNAGRLSAADVRVVRQFYGPPNWISEFAGMQWVLAESGDENTVELMPDGSIVPLPGGLDHVARWTIGRQRQELQFCHENGQVMLSFASQATRLNWSGSFQGVPVAVNRRGVSVLVGPMSHGDTSMLQGVESVVHLSGNRVLVVGSTGTVRMLTTDSVFSLATAGSVEVPARGGPRDPAEWSWASLGTDHERALLLARNGQNGAYRAFGFDVNRGRFVSATPVAYSAGRRPRGRAALLELTSERLLELPPGADARLLTLARTGDAVRMTARPLAGIRPQLALELRRGVVGLGPPERLSVFCGDGVSRTSIGAELAQTAVVGLGPGVRYAYVGQRRLLEWRPSDGANRVWQYTGPECED